MRTPLEVRRNITAFVLRRRARAEKDGKVAARLLAMAAVLAGASRETAAELGGMTRQTLRDWVIRYNAHGIEGLRDKPKGHSPRHLSPEQEKELEALVLRGPDPDGRLVRWRRVDLQAVIEQRFGVAYHERSVGKVLRRLGFVRLSVRPLHPKADLAAQADFKKTASPSGANPAQ